MGGQTRRRDWHPSGFITPLPPEPTGRTVARLPDHFYFDAETTQVRLVSQLILVRMSLCPRFRLRHVWMLCLC